MPPPSVEHQISNHESNQRRGCAGNPAMNPAMTRWTGRDQRQLVKYQNSQILTQHAAAFCRAPNLKSRVKSKTWMRGKPGHEPGHDPMDGSRPTTIGKIPELANPDSACRRLLSSTKSQITSQIKDVDARETRP